eukprot:TRINITY_DN122906_c0_g1_i1.p1 TRINITY_DN122906_c0_g1~~TRINITY_DN122906_c0_g1_i1.p1  ORF type:complete len:543 (-),score=41.67 TRINITY_DN122906_c0_g1_i1:403-2010(-)
MTTVRLPDCRPPASQSESRRSEQKANLPWWFYGGCAFVLLNIAREGGYEGAAAHFAQPDTAGSTGAVQGGLRGSQEERRLPVEQHLVSTITDGGHVPAPGDGVRQEDVINVSVPCIGWYAYKSDNYVMGYGGLLSPCGTISVGKDGQDVSYPFGTFRIPNKQKLHKWAVKVDETFAHWLWIVFALFLLGDIVWHALFYFYPEIQPDYFDEIKDLWHGKLSPPDSFLSPEEVQDWKEARLEYDSVDFAVRGNIFRVLAVFEPRDPNVGWYRWSQYVIRGLLCAWMQLYLPYSFIRETLAFWQYRGPKSLFWLSTNFGQFAVTFAALGELASIFFGKARSHFIKGAKANNFILSHKNPYRGATTYEEVETTSPTALMTPRVDGRTPRDLVLMGSGRPDWALTDKLFRGQQYFWCILSMAINFMMSLLLPCVFLLRAATYQGDVAGIAVQITALYFVFDLDTKIMESDSSLQVRYRYVIKRQKAMGLRPESEHPKTMTRVVGITQLVMDFSVKYLLLFSLGSAWQGGADGQVIGGNPF